MSDGHSDRTALTPCEAFDAFVASHLPALPAAPRADPARAHRPAPFDLGALAEWLPRLGTVLWLERRETAAPAPSRISAGARLLLLEHAAAGTLARCARVRAHSAVTSQGPREWLCFHAESGEVDAKLFMLPDSDYLAWDQMSTAQGLAPAEASRHEAPTHAAFLRRALARLGPRWRARLLAFDLKPMPWLHTLGAHAPLRISLLGLDIARTIVRNENAEWISPLHFA